RWGGGGFGVGGRVRGGGGRTGNARLVDASTGLIVQTATVSGATPEEVVSLLPRLAHVLQLSDRKKAEFEEELARRAAAVPVAVFAEVPPAPEVPPPTAPAPPPRVAWPGRPPVSGERKVDPSAALPAAPPPGPVPPAPVLVAEREEPIRKRLLLVSVQLGDGLFRCGRYREAVAHYELALALSPG